MNKKKIFLRILVPVIIILIIAGIVVTNSLMEKSKLVPANQPDAVGNTAGNLYNSGLFCEAGEKIFFSNLYDGGSLYSMNLDQTDIQKIASGDISNINVAGNYVYYYSSSNGGNSGLGYVRDSRGIYRCKKSGENAVSVQEAISDGLLLVGDTLYYTRYSSGTDSSGNADVTLASCSTNGGEETTVLQQNIKLGSAENQLIYYAGMADNHYLYSYDTVSGTTTLVNDSTYMYLPIVSEGYVYYLDLEDDYHLKRCTLSGDDVTTIVNERIDSYNMFGSVIYYQTAETDDYALKRIYTDGTGEELVASGVYSDISVTSTYVYFHTFGAEFPMYMTPTYGAVNVTTFDAAYEAVYGADADSGE